MMIVVSLIVFIAPIMMMFAMASTLARNIANGIDPSVEDQYHIIMPFLVYIWLLAYIGLK